MIRRGNFLVKEEFGLFSAGRCVKLSKSKYWFPSDRGAPIHRG
jgi:hypothetical protein